jgi:hypothetical protein
MFFIAGFILLAGLCVLVAVLSKPDVGHSRGANPVVPMIFIAFIFLPYLALRSVMNIRVLDDELILRFPFRNKVIRIVEDEFAEIRICREQEVKGSIYVRSSTIPDHVIIKLKNGSEYKISSTDVRDYYTLESLLRSNFRRYIKS